MKVFFQSCPNIVHWKDLYYLLFNFTAIGGTVIYMEVLSNFFYIHSKYTFDLAAHHPHCKRRNLY